MLMLVVMDSFKGNLTSLQAGQSVARGLADEQISSLVLPIADGGEGTTEALHIALGGKMQTVGTVDSLGKSCSAQWLALPNRHACIEFASCCGLSAVPRRLRDPYNGSSRGVGLALSRIFAFGAKEVLVTLGGSGTVDGGWGLLHELGLRAFDRNGMVLSPCGQNLNKIYRIDASLLKKFSQRNRLRYVWDVNAPLVGAEGAVQHYGPQKGLKELDFDRFEQGLSCWVDMLSHEFHRDLFATPGCGAAGGAGAALGAISVSQGTSGFQMVAKALKLDLQIQSADLVISGEGRLDSQSCQGKVIGQLSSCCRRYNKPLIVLCGSLKGDLSTLFQDSLSAALTIGNGALRFTDALLSSQEDLRRTAQQVVRLLRLGGRFFND